MIKEITPDDILDGIMALLNQAKKNSGMKLAVASASKNAFVVIDRLGIGDYFDFIADAGKILNTKPDPEVFQRCAQALGVNEGDCIGLEDSQAGIEAIESAGMFSVGIGVDVTSIEPRYSLGNTEQLKYDHILQAYSEWRI